MRRMAPLRDLSALPGCTAPARFVKNSQLKQWVINSVRNIVISYCLFYNNQLDQSSASNQNAFRA